jgi:uncharacterized protein
MNIIIFGAAGDVGSRLVTEALHKGHKVTAVVRRQSQLGLFAQSVQTFLGDVSDPEVVEAAAVGHDQIISAVRPAEGQEQVMQGLTKSLLQAAAKLDIPITLVGGAARLKLPDGSGHTVLSAPDFLPASVVGIAEACFSQYQTCLDDNQAKWIYATPPAMLSPGIRTGQFRFGGDELITDAEGKSAISMEDFACAILDQLKMTDGYQRGFTAAY